MAKKRRTYNTRSIKRNLSYSIQEISELFGLHENAVLRWVKDGLSIIDQKKPYLINGQELADYLDLKQTKRRTKLKPDEFHCCKCRAPRKAWENQVDILIKNQSKLIISGLCCVCETIIHRLGSMRKLEEYQKIFSIQTIQEEHIIDRNSPSVKCDIKKGN